MLKFVNSYIFRILNRTFREMLKFFLPSDKKRIIEKLTEVGLASGGHRNITNFRHLAILIVTDTIKGSRLDSYIEVLTKINPTPDLVLKWTVLIHIYLQERTQINSSKIISFLSTLLEKCLKMQDLYAKQESK